MNEKKIAIASDHGGYSTKETIKELLVEKGFEVDDLGTDSADSVDYPDFGHLVAQRIASGKNLRAILICGTGIGMSITANRYPQVRAALCNDLFSSKMSRRHNDSNVLVMGGRVVGEELAKEIVSTWLDTDFEGGRHVRRLDKIDKGRVETVVHRVVSKYLDRIEDVNHSDLEKMVEESMEIVLKNKNKKNKDK